MSERWQAVLDIGTNSVLLLVARPGSGAALEVALDRCVITRLGEGVAGRGSLSPAAIERTLAALTELRASAASYGAALTAVTTEGVRLAGDPESFLAPAGALLGAPVRVLSGEEEARLSYLSVAVESPAEEPLRVLDIGGASTELVVGVGASISSAVSHRIGSVRLTERFLGGVKEDEPPPASAIAAMAAAVRETLAAQPLPPSDRLHGLAGTVTTAAALLLGLEVYDRERVDGSLHRVEDVIALRDRLASIPFAARISPTLPAKRADVIVAGLTILIGALEHCGASTLVVRDRGLRYALIER